MGKTVGKLLAYSAGPWRFLRQEGFASVAKGGPWERAEHLTLALWSRSCLACHLPQTSPPYPLR